MKKGYTDVTIVLDRSGSMHSIAKDMEGALESFINDQKKISGECRVTFVRFDTEYELVFSGCLLENVPQMKLQPRGGTALLDALGKIIIDNGIRFKLMKEEDRPEKVLTIVITDGEENSSREFSRAKIFEMINHQRSKYNWEFIYLGANQDSIAATKDLGFDSLNVYNFHGSSKGTRHAVNVTSRAFASYRKGNSSTVDNFLDTTTDGLLNETDNKLNTNNP